MTDWPTGYNFTEEQQMKPLNLYRVLKKRIEGRDSMLLLSKTRDGSYSRQYLGTYYLHDVKANKILRTHINLLELAKELNVECIDTLEETCYA
jgi:hypothetical protein